jgi:small-conductance mechanosensitive channel
MTYLPLDALSNWMMRSGMQIALVLLLGLVAQQLIRFVASRIQNSMRQSKEGTASERAARAETLTGVFSTAASAAIWFIVSLMALDKLGINIGPLITSAGVAGFAIGFGSQELIKDTISGLFFLYENQFNTGDRLIINDKQGVVKAMNLRTVTLKGDNGELYIVRNSQIGLVTKLPAKRPEIVAQEASPTHA